MATTSIAQMDAVVIQESGPPAESLAVRSEAVPEPGPGETLVEVHAAAVNPLDIANIAGPPGPPPAASPRAALAGGRAPARARRAGGPGGHAAAGDPRCRLCRGRRLRRRAQWPGGVG